VFRLLALMMALAAPAAFGDAPTSSPQAGGAAYHAASAPLSAALRSELRAGGFSARGCPTPMSHLRVLSVSVHNWHGRTRTGQLIVNQAAVAPLTTVFHRLYAIDFPIRHMQIADFYGPRRQRPADGDVTESFECRQAAASPCTGGSGTGSWSMHAYGLAVDLDPHENPYVGCGQSRDPTLRRYRARTRHYKGMVGGRAIRAFASVGWGWGGSWAGNTKDYMHFSSTGH
jgi:hypothetical protein